MHSKPSSSRHRVLTCLYVWGYVGNQRDRQVRYYAWVVTESDPLDDSSRARRRRRRDNARSHSSSLGKISSSSCVAQSVVVWCLVAVIQWNERTLVVTFLWRGTHRSSSARTIHASVRLQRHPLQHFTIYANYVNYAHIYFVCVFTFRQHYRAGRRLVCRVVLLGWIVRLHR